MKVLSCLIVLVALSNAFADKHSFRGYKLVRITPATQEQKNIIGQWEHNPEFDFWERNPNTVDVLLSPEVFAKYESLFNSLNLKYQVIQNDIQEKIDEETKSMQPMNGKREAKNIVGKFARYSEINNFVDDIVANNPDIASTYNAGKTFENRDLKVLVLKTANSKRSIWIDCGFHAREWIAVTTCVWIIDKVLKDYRSTDPTLLRILNQYELHILPLTNPDGYEYSHQTYRLWRKNRAVRSGSTCVGVDLNRNFGFQWMTAGASSNPCSDTYAGPVADSELETKAVENAILKKKGDWDAYLTIHTYGNYWLTSWSYTTALPPDFDDILAKAKIGAEGIKSHVGTVFTVGHSGQLFGRLAGVSDDWAKGNATVKYSYTLELAPGNSDSDSFYGFTLPEDRAPRVGEETYKGIKAFLNSIF